MFHIICQQRNSNQSTHHYTPIRMVKIQNAESTKCWWGARATATLIRCWWECKMVQPFWKTVWCFLIKLNILLLYDPKTVLLDIYPKELKTYVHTKPCTWMFIADLLWIAQTWKQPRCSPVAEWINQLVHPDNEILFSAKKKWQSPKRTWGNLKHPSARSQFEKVSYYYKWTTLVGDVENAGGCAWWGGVGGGTRGICVPYPQLLWIQNNLYIHGEATDNHKESLLSWISLILHIFQF